MDRTRFRGLAVAMVTPMTADGLVDFGALGRHVEWLLEGGVDVLVPCGTTGESATLAPEEQAAVIAAVVERCAGRRPVLAGAGSNHTAEAVRLARNARHAGADGILSVGPYYNRPTQEGFRRHYQQIAAATDLPLFIYNVPGRTGGNIRPETVLVLAEEAETIVGVKEASGDFGQVLTLLRERPDDFLVLAGDDEITLATIALGGDGVVSVAGNEVPATMKALVDAALREELEAARALFFRLLPLMRANFIESNPIPVKTALERMGRFPAHMRLPLVPMSEAGVDRLLAALRTAGVTDLS